MGDRLGSILNVAFALFMCCSAGIAIWVAVSGSSAPQKQMPKKNIGCVDMRDGERFSFSSHDILESGLAFDWPIGEWVKLRDSTGQIRVIFPSASHYFKCKEIS